MGIGDGSVAHVWEGACASASSDAGGSGGIGVGAGSGGESDATEVGDDVLLLEGEAAARRGVAVVERGKEAGARAGIEVRARSVVSAGAGVDLEATAPERLGAAAQGKEMARGLQLGSADPHMVREPGEVQEPWRRGSGAFSINRLDPADGRELCLRALPDMNPIPSTVAREAGSGQRGGAPVITSIDQVIPGATLLRIGKWRARLKACLKAAARGSYRLAKELRPPDLELVSAENTVGRAQGWVWDLRPLAKGEAAIPIAESSWLAPPLTDLKLSCVATLGEEYADQEIISEMLSGFSDDAVGVESHVVLSPPHLGALKYAAQALEKVAGDVARGWSHVEEAIPFWPIRSNPYSIVREEREARVKYRMTIDLSWPHPSAGRSGAVSVNDAIDRSAWVQVRLMRVAQLAEVIAILKTSGVPVKLWAFDCQAYYRKTGRQRGEVWRNCVAVSEGFVVDEREQFGDASAAVKCCRQSSFLAWLVARALAAVDAEFPPSDARVLAWLAKRRAAKLAVREGSEVGSCGIYVDDGGGASLDDALHEAQGAPVRKSGPDELGSSGEHCGAVMRRAEAHFRAAVMAISATGHASEVSKEVPPCDKNVSLGVELDVEGEGRMRLSVWKRERYAERAEQVLARAVCGGEEFESLLHRLLFAASCMPEGRQFLNPLFRVAKASFRLSGGRVVVTSRVRHALRWWVKHLGGSHEGVPLACRGAFPSLDSGEVVVMYSDASGGFGFGAWTFWRGEVLYIAGEWDAAEQGGLHINVKELLATTAALATFLEATAARYAVEFTDNTVAEGAARRLAPSSAQLQRLVERRVRLLRERDSFTELARVGTHENIWADLISRQGGLGEFLEQVRCLGLAARRLEVAEAWRCTAALWSSTGDPELEHSAKGADADGRGSSSVPLL